MKKNNKKTDKWEAIIIFLVVGLINGGLIQINNAIDTIYDLYLIEYPFFVYWAVLIIFGLINGFFYVCLWAIIKRFFGEKIT